MSLSFYEEKLASSVFLKRKYSHDNLNILLLLLKSSDKYALRRHDKIAKFGKLKFQSLIL